MGNSYIRLKDTYSGVTSNFPVAYLDWGRLTTVDPDVTYSVGAIDGDIAFTFGREHGLIPGQLIYYKLHGSGQSTVDPYLNGYLNQLVTGAVPPSKGGGGMVFFQSPQYWHSTADDVSGVLSAGVPYSYSFQETGGGAPPSDINHKPYYYTKSTPDGDRYSMLINWTPNLTMFKNERASREFVTTSGVQIGACIGIGSGAGREFAVTNGPNFLNGSEVYNASLSHWGDYVAAVDGDRVLADGAIIGQEPIGWNCGSAVTGTIDPYNYFGEHTDDPVITGEVSVQMVATKIDGNEYLGLAVIRWDPTTESVNGIGVTFFPSAYWGTFYVDPNDKPPTSDEQYFGEKQPPSRGGGGTYTYHNNTVIETTTPTSALSVFGPLDPGIHIYEITGSDMKGIISKIWQGGDNSIANGIVGSILSFGYLPEKFTSDVGGTPTNVIFVGRENVFTTQPPQAYPKHLNDSQFTQIRGQFRLRIEPFFGNYLDYEGYTSIKLFLPFVGSLDIPPSTCTAASDDPNRETGWIKVNYRCDIATGNVVAEIICIDEKKFQTVHYATGNALIKFPIYGNALSQTEMLGSIAGAVSGVTSTVTGISSGNWAGAIGGAFQTAQSVMRAQNPQQHNMVASNFNGNNNVISNKRVYVVVTRPQPAYDDKYVKIKGMTTARAFDQLADAYEMPDTFTVVDFAKCEDIKYATSGEKAEIEKLLREGVYLSGVLAPADEESEG